MAGRPTQEDVVVVVVVVRFLTSESSPPPDFSLEPVRRYSSRLLDKMSVKVRTKRMPRWRDDFFSKSNFIFLSPTPYSRVAHSFAQIVSQSWWAADRHSRGGDQLLGLPSLWARVTVFGLAVNFISDTAIVTERAASDHRSGRRQSEEDSTEERGGPAFSISDSGDDCG